MSMYQQKRESVKHGQPQTVDPGQYYLTGREDHESKKAVSHRVIKVKLKESSAVGIYNPFFRW